MYDLPFAAPLFDTATVDRVLATARASRRGAQRDRTHAEERRARRSSSKTSTRWRSVGAANPIATLRELVRARRSRMRARASGRHRTRPLAGRAGAARVTRDCGGLSCSPTIQETVMSVEQLKDRIGDGAQRSCAGGRRCRSSSFRRRTSRWSRRCGNRCSASTPLQPRFVSVTYGADGSTRARTHNIVTRIQEIDAADRRAASHLRRRAARRDSRHRAQLLGARHPAHRRAARRSAAGQRRSTCRIRGGFAYAVDLVQGTEVGRRLRDLGRGVSRSRIRKRRTPRSSSTI